MFLALTGMPCTGSGRGNECEVVSRGLSGNGFVLSVWHIRRGTRTSRGDHWHRSASASCDSSIAYPSDAFVPMPDANTTAEEPDSGSCQFCPISDAATCRSQHFVRWMLGLHALLVAVRFIFLHLRGAVVSSASVGDESCGWKG